MKKIFCISGLGTDEKVFSNLRIENYELITIQWINPNKNESIQDYAKRLLSQITEVNPILIGLSFGGIICLELSRIIDTKLIILISTIKSRKEMPTWMKLINYIKLHKVITNYNRKIFEPIQNFNLGAITDKEKLMARNYRNNINLNYLQWSLDVILKWDFKNLPANLYHIHGSIDRLFPIKKIKADCIINNGSHLMIFNKSGIVNSEINKIIRIYE